MAQLDRAPARYTLLPLGERSDVHDAADVARFPTIRRDDWTARIRVTQVATSVTVRIEGSPWGTDDSDWETLYESTYSSEADETLNPQTGSAPAWSTEPDESHAWIRAIVPSNTGDYVAEVEAWAPILDVDVAEEKDLLTKELREGLNATDLQRIVTRAERKILAQKLGQDDRGRLTDVTGTRLTDPQTLYTLQEAIAAQAVHEQLRDELREADQPSSLYISSGSRVPEFSSEVDEILEPLVPRSEDLRWRHR